MGSGALVPALSLRIPVGHHGGAAAISPSQGGQQHHQRGAAEDTSGSGRGARVSFDASDPFAGLDTPTVGGAGAARKLCMVCMDRERGELCMVIGMEVISFWTRLCSERPVRCGLFFCIVISTLVHSHMHIVRLSIEALPTCCTVHNLR